jgi:hypothetical protein
MARILRFARGLGLGRNPLRRRSEALEARVVLGLLAAFLVSAPLLGIAAGRWADHAGLREQRQQRDWQQVSATLLRPAPGEMIIAYGAWALARWTAPDGQVRTGDIAVTGNGWTGGKVSMWVDRQGWPTGPPLSHQQLADRAIGAAVLAPVGLALLLSGIGLLVHYLLNRRRLAGWEAAWASIGPHWTKRSHP